MYSAVPVLTSWVCVDLVQSNSQHKHKLSCPNRDPHCNIVTIFGAISCEPAEHYKPDSKEEEHSQRNVEHIEIELGSKKPDMRWRTEDGEYHSGGDENTDPHKNCRLRCRCKLGDKPIVCHFLGFIEELMEWELMMALALEELIWLKASWGT